MWYCWYSEAPISPPVRSLPCRTVDTQSGPGRKDQWNLIGPMIIHPSVVYVFYREFLCMIYLLAEKSMRSMRTSLIPPASLPASLPLSTYLTPSLHPSFTPCLPASISHSLLRSTHGSGSSSLWPWLWHVVTECGRTENWDGGSQETSGAGERAARKEEAGHRCRAIRDRATGSGEYATHSLIDFYRLVPGVPVAWVTSLLSQTQIHHSVGCSSDVWQASVMCHIHFRINAMVLWNSNWLVDWLASNKRNWCWLFLSGHLCFYPWNPCRSRIVTAVSHENRHDGRQRCIN